MQEQARPYRSHKIPACDRCRRFKRRCTGGTSERPCVLCDLQEVPCVKSSSPSATTRTRRRVKQDRRHVLPPKIAPAHAVPAIPGDDETAHIGRDYHSSAHQDKSKKELSMLAGPVISEDIQILERYMSNTMSSTEVAPLPVTSTPANPMVYLRVPRRREGLAMAENPGKRQKEILMQILQPYADELVRLYFEESHMAFPILDEQLFLELYKSGDKLSPVLTCDFFAFALILWHHSPVLRQFPKPDAYFIWNLAVEALQQDFLAPGLSTVYSVIMDMTGRPVISMLGNTINNGRAVILAQSLGLNRDPTNWRRSKSEKSLRIRLWWAVVIHDRWSSYAHGISPTITKSRYDVPIPVLSDILTGPNQSEKRLKSAQSFIHLCTLTEILGEILPLVYDLNTDHTDWNQITRLQSDLDNWESNLPEYLRRDTQTKTQRVCGSSNLQLSYLSVRLLLNRVSLHAAKLPKNTTQTPRNHLTNLRHSAQEIVSYVCSLTKSQLQEFWLPYTAHHLILTIIILLRCTIESPDKSTITSCKTSLRRLWTKLENVAQNDAWDLATICMSQCRESVTAFLEAPVDGRWEQHEQEGRNADDEATGELVVPDILPFSDPDISFDGLWDGLYGLGWMGMEEFSVC